MSVDSQSENNLEPEFLNIIEDDNYSSVGSTTTPSLSSNLKDQQTKKNDNAAAVVKKPLKSSNKKLELEDFDYNTLLSIRDTDLHKHYKVVSEPTSKSSSPVWKYYGLLHSQDEDELIDKVHFYCIPCFEESKSKRYQKSTSTGNLIKHLVKIHNISLSQTFRIKQQKDGIGITVTKQDSAIGNDNDDDGDGDGDGDNYLGDGVEGKPTKTVDDDDYDYLVNDINEIIICEVAKRPQLYDNRLIHHRGTKHHIRRALWVEVYTALNGLVTYEKLQNIWKNIRDRYNKIRRDTINGLPPKTKYRYFDLLRFLDDVHISSNALFDDSLVDTINIPVGRRPRAYNKKIKNITKNKNQEQEEQEAKEHDQEYTRNNNIHEGNDDDSYLYTIDQDADDADDDEHGQDGDDDNNNEEYIGETIVEHLDEVDVHVKNSNDLESTISICYPNYSNQNEQETNELKVLTIEDENECENVQEIHNVNEDDDDDDDDVEHVQEYIVQNEIDEILENVDADDIDSNDVELVDNDSNEPNRDVTVNTEQDQEEHLDQDSSNSSVSYCNNDEVAPVPRSRSMIRRKPVTKGPKVTQKQLTKPYLGNNAVDNPIVDTIKSCPAKNRLIAKLMEKSNPLKRNVNVTNYDISFKKFIVDENYTPAGCLRQPTQKKVIPQQFTESPRNKGQKQQHQLEKTNRSENNRIDLNNVKFEMDVEPVEMIPKFIESRLQSPSSPHRVKSQVQEKILPPPTILPPLSISPPLTTMPPIIIPPPPETATSPITHQLTTPAEYQQSYTITNIEPPYYDLNRELDEYDLFGNLVAKVMKNMKRKKSRILQTKILELIQIYDDDNAM